MILQYKKNKPDVKDPFKQNASDIGWDVYAYSMKVVGELIEGTDLYSSIDYIEYNLELSIQPQPEFIDALGNVQKYFTYLAPRSSIRGKNLRIAAGFGTIDNGYKDSILASFEYKIQPKDHIFFDIGKHPCFGIRIDQSKIYKIGERCAQLIVTTQPMVTLQEVEELAATDRNGGHGSTGVAWCSRKFPNPPRGRNINIIPLCQKAARREWG